MYGWDIVSTTIFQISLLIIYSSNFKFNSSFSEVCLLLKSVKVPKKKSGKLGIGIGTGSSDFRPADMKWFKFMWFDEGYQFLQHAFNILELVYHLDFIFLQPCFLMSVRKYDNIWRITTLTKCLYYFCRFQEKNLNLDQDSKLGPPDL